MSQRANRVNQTQEVQYFNQRNQGPSAARNSGIAKARGEYIAFLDSDDVWLPGKLEWQVRAIDQFQNRCGVCFTDTLLVNDSGAHMTTFRRHYEQTIGIEPDAIKLLAKSFCGLWVSTLLVRTDLMKQIGGFDPVVHFGEDRDLYFRLSLVKSVVYVNKVLARVDRTSRLNESKCREWEDTTVRLDEQQQMYEKWMAMEVKLPAEVFTLIKQALRALHSDWSNWYLRPSNITKRARQRAPL